MSAIRELTLEEQRAMSWERTQAWLRNKDDIRPFTPEEARYHAKQFIAKNGRNNLVRLLAEAFIELQDSAVT